MNKKHLFFILTAVVIILLGFNLNKTESFGNYVSKGNICYKYKGPAGPKGLHLKVLSCNGGFKCTTYTCGHLVCCSCVPMPDCGINGVGCNSPRDVTIGNLGAGACTNVAATVACASNPEACGPKAGCLNYICNEKRRGNNAIWDIKTKKCGCDDGWWPPK